MGAYETFEHAGLTVKIYPDDDPQNPRKDFDNSSTMVCWHRNSNLGDEQVSGDDYESMAHLVASFEAVIVRKLWLYEHSGMTMKIGDEVTVKKELRADCPECGKTGKVILDDHEVYCKACKASIGNEDDEYCYSFELEDDPMRGNAFSDRWDSGLVGFIYMTEKQIRDCYLIPTGEIPAEIMKKANELMESDVEVYDQYLTGDVWGFVINTGSDDADLDDSCWGFFGKEYCESEARSAAESCREYLDKQAAAEALEAAYWARADVATVAA